MPDDQMRGLREVFAPAAPSDDETTERPRPSPGALGGLGGLRTPALDLEDDSQTETGPEGTVAEIDDADLQRQSQPRPYIAGPPDNDPRYKTSFSLSPALLNRISVAYRNDRWTIADLIALGLERVDSRRITNADVERAVRAQAADASSAVKSVKLTLSDKAELDELARSLRLSRSQYMAALVAEVLDSLR